jgi:tRNA(Ile)-lysidine synthase
MPRPLDIDFSPVNTRSAGALVVALSGGLDSSVLLHALATHPAARDRGLRALHVHHGLHADADGWQAHCERACAALDVPLAVARVHVEPEGDGPEAAARRARHAAFEGALGHDDILVLAHHRDDQAETFLLRALRASGPDGLRAMRPWRACGRGWLWRPLLQTPRPALRAYAAAHGIDWIEDGSNADTAFDRNFLRARVMPLLRERWPQADALLARSAALSSDAAVLLDADDAALLDAATAATRDVLDIETLRALAPQRRARVLRRWIASGGLPPLPADGVRRIDAELLPARNDAQARFDWHGASIRAWCGRLHAGRAVAPLDPAFDSAWNGRAPLQLPDGGLLAFTCDPGLPATTRVRARRGGERIRLPGRAHSHALKHVLQEMRVPPWVREHLPLLVDGDEVLAAGDLVISQPLRALLDASGAALLWTRPAGA